MLKEIIKSARSNYRTLFIVGMVSGLAACTSSQVTDPAPIHSLTNNQPSSEAEYSRASESTVTEENISEHYQTPPKNIRVVAPINQVDTPSEKRMVVENVAHTEKTASNKTADEGYQYNRNYQDIPKGGYKGDYYIVKRGDTLFYIAWVTGNDYRALAKHNKISEPYALRLGQRLDVRGDAVGSSVATTDDKTSAKPKETTSWKTTSVSTASSHSAPHVEKVSPVKPAVKTQDSTATSGKTAKVVAQEPKKVEVVSPPSTSTKANAIDGISWHWPTKGMIIERFSSGANGNKGIDISGDMGQAITASASGRVVYAGNALRGYGNLIIIKHNDDYLSAYAHNDKILVHEQQDVKAGQEIATMGKTGTTSTRLHFEIRYKGRSVDPQSYLP